MTSPPLTAAKDKNYNLISAVRDSLQNVWQLETYATDAQREGDTELAEWFQKMQHENQKAAEQGKQMLLERIQHEGG